MGLVETLIFILHRAKLHRCPQGKGSSTNTLPKTWSENKERYHRWWHDTKCMSSPPKILRNPRLSYKEQCWCDSLLWERKDELSIVPSINQQCKYWEKNKSDVKRRKTTTKEKSRPHFCRSRKIRKKKFFSFNQLRNKTCINHHEAYQRWKNTTIKPAYACTRNKKEEGERGRKRERERERERGETA